MWVINVYPHSSSKGDCYTKEHGRLDILILLRFLAVKTKSATFGSLKCQRLFFDVISNYVLGRQRRRLFKDVSFNQTCILHEHEVY